MNKHIAMWSAPRSRSSVMTRAFEQIEACMILDESFYALYLLFQECLPSYEKLCQHCVSLVQ